MIGSTFDVQSNARQRYLVVAAASLLLAVLGWFVAPWLGVIGLTLTIAGLFGAIVPSSRLQIELRPEGLHLQPGARLIPYGTIIAVCGLRKHKQQAGLKPFPIDVCTGDSGVRLPEDAAIPAQAVEDFLISRASPFIFPPGDTDVAQFYDEECAKHGANAVALFHGRTSHIETFGRRHLRWFAGGWILGSFIAMSIFLNLYSRSDSVGGAVAVMLGTGIVLLLVELIRNVRFGLKRQAAHTGDSLVVAPSGLALRQGKLKGKLRWDEVRNITMKPAGNSGATGSLSTGAIGRQCLHLQVAGAVVVLLEVYDRSLTQIHRTIEYHCHRKRPLPTDFA